MDYFIANDNTKIYYKLTGEGTPIIFIHGFGASHDEFRIPEKVLSKKYKTISYDLRGHGLSVKIEKEPDINILARDLRQLIYHLNLEDVVLVGWSLGGSVIFEYLSQFGEDRISKVSLVDTSPKVVNDINWNLGLYHGEYILDDAIFDLDLIKKSWPNFSQKFIKTMAPNLKEYQLKRSIEKMSKNKAELMYNIWKSILDKDYRQVISNISLPTLLLFGGKSTLYSSEVGKYLNDKICDSKLIVFEECTHLLVLENPIKFNRVLEEFINNKDHSL